MNVHGAGRQGKGTYSAADVHSSRVMRAFSSTALPSLYCVFPDVSGAQTRPACGNSNQRSRGNLVTTQADTEEKMHHPRIRGETNKEPFGSVQTLPHTSNLSISRSSCNRYPAPVGSDTQSQSCPCQRGTHTVTHMRKCKPHCTANRT